MRQLRPGMACHLRRHPSVPINDVGRTVVILEIVSPDRVLWTQGAPRPDWVRDLVVRVEGDSGELVVDPTALRPIEPDDEGAPVREFAEAA